MNDKLTRRRLLTAGAVAPLATAAAAASGIVGPGMPWHEGEASLPDAARAAATPATAPAYGFFSPAEAAFIEAAVARLIPADELGGGAVEAGVPVFLDRQLSGAFGRGDGWYMQGPWRDGLPTQGFQTRMTPVAIYRTALREIDAAVAQEGKGASFAKLTAADQDRWLTQLEKGEPKLPTADAKTFFTMLLQNTLEGFWSDPMYGGNRDMLGWKLIGFPGARYDHLPYVAKHGEKYPLSPVGLKGRTEWLRKA